MTAIDMTATDGVAFEEAWAGRAAGCGALAGLQPVTFILHFVTYNGISSLKTSCSSPFV